MKKPAKTFLIERIKSPYNGPGRACLADP